MDATEEEFAEALTEVNAADPPEVATEGVEAPPAPSKPAQQGATASEIAAAVAKALAESEAFGRPRVEAPAPPQQRKLTIKEQLAMMTPEQRQELETRMVTGGIAAAMDLAQAIVKEEMEGVTAQAQVYVASTGTLLIDSFIGRKASNDKFFKQIEPLFRKEVASINRATLAGLTEADRDRQLEYFWAAASDKMFRSAKPNTAASPPVMGVSSGRGGATTPTKKTSVFAKGDGLTDLVAYMKQRNSITDKDLEEIEAIPQDEW